MAATLPTAEEIRTIVREELQRALGERQGPELLTTDQAAAALGLSPKTIRRRIRAGELAAERRGGTWRIRREALAGPGPTAAELLRTLPSGR
jgi:excisionase family DNA binding protein